MNRARVRRDKAIRRGIMQIAGWNPSLRLHWLAQTYVSSSALTATTRLRVFGYLDLPRSVDRLMRIYRIHADCEANTPLAVRAGTGVRTR